MKVLLEASAVDGYPCRLSVSRADPFIELHGEDQGCLFRVKPEQARMLGRVLRGVADEIDRKKDDTYWNHTAVEPRQGR